MDFLLASAFISLGSEPTAIYTIEPPYTRGYRSILRFDSKHTRAFVYIFAFFFCRHGISRKEGFIIINFVSVYSESWANFFLLLYEDGASFIRNWHIRNVIEQFILWITIVLSYTGKRGFEKKIARCRSEFEVWREVWKIAYKKLQFRENQYKVIYVKF